MKTIDRTRPIGSILLALVLGGAVPASAVPTPVAAPSVAPRTQPIRVDSAELARAAGARLQAEPKRVVRLSSRLATPNLGPRQDVVVRQVGGTAAGAKLGCDARRVSIYRVSGDATPRGTLTLSGSCFGAATGTVEMLGSGLPDGGVRLGVTSWSDGSVTASIPAIAGVADQAVQIRLSKTAYGLAHERSQPIASTTTSSELVPMRFVAARETVIVPVGWWANTSCGDNIGNAFTATNSDDCGHFVSTDGFTGWAGAFDFHNPAFIGDHVRPGVNATGEDTWQARLPAGWLFDRIEFVSGASDTEVTILPTLDPAHVSWRARWKTVHVVDKYGAREEATYAMVVFATGPAGMAYKRTQ